MDDIKQPKQFRPKPQTYSGPSNSTQNIISDPNPALGKIEPIDDLDINLASSISQKENILPPKKNKKKFMTKKKWLLFALIFLIIGALGASYFIFIKKEAPKQQNEAKVEEVKIVEVKKDIVSPLTGKILENESLANRVVTGIMIENSPESRPQSGLTEADMVYEAIAEGGITRFLAVYQESQPQYIGPVRSSRPYYLDFILPLNGSYGHVGGSPDALAAIKTLGVRDLDQFYNGNAYTRITERYAPHNVYTSFAKLDELNKSKGFNTSSFTPLERKKDVPQTPVASIIDFSISGPLYSPRFTYDPGTNTYLRSQNGQPHTDLKSKTQIAPKTVVALIMEKGYDPDGYHTAYKTTGSGKIFVFQDGVVSEGAWSKKDSKSPLILTDKNGFPLKLNSGQTWFSLVSSSSDVTYKP